MTGFGTLQTFVAASLNVRLCQKPTVARALGRLRRVDRVGHGGEQASFKMQRAALSEEGDGGAALFYVFPI